MDNTVNSLQGVVPEEGAVPCLKIPRMGTEEHRKRRAVFDIRHEALGVCPKCLRSTIRVSVVAFQNAWIAEVRCLCGNVYACMGEDRQNSIDDIVHTWNNQRNTFYGG